jgi:hypothetical protein
MKRIITYMCIALTTITLAEVDYGNLKGTADSVTIAEGETFTVLANNFNTFEVYSDTSDIRV